MNIIERLLEEIFNEKLATVKHSVIKVKHLTPAKKRKAKQFRVKNKARLKLKAKKRKLKLKNKPKAKPGYSWSANGVLVKKQKRVGIRR